MPPAAASASGRLRLPVGRRGTHWTARAVQEERGRDDIAPADPAANLAASQQAADDAATELAAWWGRALPETFGVVGASQPEVRGGNSTLEDASCRSTTSSGRKRRR
jgi:hypothetical protein